MDFWILSTFFGREDQVRISKFIPLCVKLSSSFLNDRFCLCQVVVESNGVVAMALDASFRRSEERHPCCYIVCKRFMLSSPIINKIRHREQFQKHWNALCLIIVVRLVLDICSVVLKRNLLQCSAICSRSGFHSATHGLTTPDGAGRERISGEEMEFVLKSLKKVKSWMKHWKCILDPLS